MTQTSNPAGRRNRPFTVYLHNDETGELMDMRVMAKSMRDAEDIAAGRTNYEWIIDSVEEN